jgi:hypothetical protein
LGSGLPKSLTIFLAKRQLANWEVVRRFLFRTWLQPLFQLLFHDFWLAAKAMWTKPSGETGKALHHPFGLGDRLCWKSKYAKSI